MSLDCEERDELLWAIAEFIDRPRGEAVTPGDVSTYRHLVARLTDLAMPLDEEGHSPVAVEVFDARRERVKTIRVPHAHLLRDPHDPDGASMAEAMRSLEVVALTASDAVRSIAGELAHQETDRERRARHIAICDPVRRWGEALMESDPGIGRLLVNYASSGVLPGDLNRLDADRMGIGAADLSFLLSPEGQEELRARLVAMARQRLANKEA